MKRNTFYSILFVLTLLIAGVLSSCSHHLVAQKRAQIEEKKNIANRRCVEVTVGILMGTLIIGILYNNYKDNKSRIKRYLEQ